MYGVRCPESNVCRAQYVGTALSSVLGRALLEELVVDPAMLHIKARGGLQPEEITPDLILRARNVVDTNFHRARAAGGRTGLEWRANRAVSRQRDVSYT